TLSFTGPELAPYVPEPSTPAMPAMSVPAGLAASQGLQAQNLQQWAVPNESRCPLFTDVR
ncbi:hypothetical protein DSO57_1021746, partial [Entomophthora muscae]